MATLSRWTVFIVLSICMFAYTYTYDIPVALQEQLQYYYSISNVQYTLLFSAYAWPNCVIPILVGLLTDKIGVNVVICVCFMVCVAGNAVYVMATYYGYYPLMLIGRSVYGVGAESFVMAETPLIYEYFKGKELSFALGANLSFSRLGSSVNDITTYIFYDMYGGKRGILIATTMGFILLLICLLLLSALILHRVLYNTQDLRFEVESQELNHKTNNNNYNDTNMTPNNLTLTKDYSSFMSNVSKDKTMRTKSMDSTLSIHSLKNDINIFELEANSKFSNSDLGKEDDDDFRLSDITKFDIRFWLLVVNTCLIYGCVEPWMKIGGSFMQSVFHFSHKKANYYLTIPYITSGVLTPFVGYYVDRMGYRCHLLLLSTILLTITHYLFMEGIINEILNIFSLLMIGVAYSIFCGVIWPAFALVVHPKTLGTAYGIGVAGYNLFLGTFFIIVGILASEQDEEEERDEDEDDGLDEMDSHRYIEVQYFLLSMALLSMFTVLLLWWFDNQKGSELKKPTIKPKAVHDLDMYLNDNEYENENDANDTMSSVGLAKF